MALKFAVKTLEEIPEALRGEYVQDAELGFKLAIEPGSGIEDPAELRRAHEREKTERKAAQKKLKELEDAQSTRDEEARAEREKALRAAGDVDALQKSWQEKYDRDLAAERAKWEPQVASM